MTIREFCEEIKAVYAKYFPYSECVTIFNPDWRYVGIVCYLSADASETSYNIRNNDMFHVGFSVDIRKNATIDDEMTDTVMESNHHDFTINPTNPYCVYGSYNVPYRKTKGNAEKIINAFDRFVERLYNAVVNEYTNGNIHKDFTEIVKAKTEC